MFLHVAQEFGVSHRFEVTPTDTLSKLLLLYAETIGKSNDITPATHTLREDGLELDLTSPIRFANLVNNAKLVVIPRSDVHQEIVVRVCIQLEDGTRKQKMSSGDVSLWQLMQELLDATIVERMKHPVLQLEGNRYSGESLSLETLRSIGFRNKSAALFHLTDEVNLDENALSSSAAAPALPTSVVESILELSSLSSVEEGEESIARTLSIEREPALYRSTATGSTDELDSDPEENEEDFTPTLTHLLRVDPNIRRTLLGEFQRKQPSSEDDSLLPSLETKLRIRLGETCHSDAVFSVTETVGDVYEYVRSLLLDPESFSFTLFSIAPRQDYTDLSQTLEEADLVPSFVLYIDYDHSKFTSESSFLKPEMYSSLPPPSPSSGVSQQAKRTSEQRNPGASRVNQPDSSISSESSSSAPSSSKQRPKLPKWLKL